MWHPSTYDNDLNKACKIEEYSDIKIFLCDKRLFVELVLACDIWYIKYNWNFTW